METSTDSGRAEATVIALEDSGLHDEPQVRAQEAAIWEAAPA